MEAPSFSSSHLLCTSRARSSLLQQNRGPADGEKCSPQSVRVPHQTWECTHMPSNTLCTRKHAHALNTPRRWTKALEKNKTLLGGLRGCLPWLHRLISEILALLAHSQADQSCTMLSGENSCLLLQFI